ncbi:MAG: DNA repair protein RadC [Bacteroidota bacterium]
MQNDHWALRETAAYKLEARGVKAVSDLELLSTIIGKQEVAQNLLDHYHSFGAIAQASLSELQQIEGITKRRAIMLKCAFELAQRQVCQKLDVPKINHSADVQALVAHKYAGLHHEMFMVIYLNRGHFVMGQEELFHGGISSVIVDPRLILKKALTYLASGIILVHNHPSGNLNPSSADLDITKKLSEGAKWFDIRVLDHVIIGHSQYYSFADEGMM